MKLLLHGIGVVLVAWGGVASATLGAAEPELPAPADRQVDFHKEVVPILHGSCVKCHTGDKPKGGFSLARREELLAGGDSGKVVLPGQSAASILIRLVAGHEPDRIMPAQGPRLKPEQIGTLRAWIDQGLKWEEGFSFRAVQQAALPPRQVALPPAVGGLQHPIDRLLAPYFQRQGITPGPVVPDRLFARRASLDLVGLLPTPDELAALEADTAPDKRAKFVRRLLADRRAYAEHWLTFWNDALRNAYRGTGYIDGGRKQITGWLYQSLAENKPYDQFVRELINPAPESEGFINGIIWRGVVNASQRREMQAAQNVSQVFLGINLKCASCHDSFINDWKLTDAYGLAAVFATGPLEIHRCDKPTGEMAQVHFLFPELGTVDPARTRPERMRQLAEIVTRPENGRLTRTLVNRLWAWLFGRGIVEPVDDLDQEPFSADLLDWLAEDFREHGYDVQHTLELICTSQAYQRASAGAPQPDATQFRFQGPIVKRMTAEQFLDGVYQVTESWPSQPAAPLPATASVSPGDLKVVYESDVLKSGATAIDVDVRGARLLVLVVTDGGNGGNYDWANWGEPRLETPAGEVRLTTLRWRSATTGHDQVRLNRNCVNKPMRLDGQPVAYGIGTHANSTIVYELPAGTTRFKAQVGPDTGAVEQKGSTPSIQFKVQTSDAAPAVRGIRTALLHDDALSRALGRPNREQVITRRDTLATTLQAIELTNGVTLDGLLKSGARHWVARQLPTSDAAIEALYQAALGRLPTADERTIARDLLPDPRQTTGYEDLLWSLLMLPEFQLIE